jgi:hypothetical protein
MMDAPRPLEPLKLSCRKSDCNSGLHCFQESKRRARFPRGSCQACGANTLVDWQRVATRSIDDVVHTFECLKHEWIRHHFWHSPIDRWALNYAVRKGRVGLRLAMPKRLQSSVGIRHSRDGRQTPWDRSMLYYAQHATACCCRKCIEYWHGIQPDQELSTKDIEYFTELCLRYIWERLPDLAEEGRHVPPIRSAQ